jgi:hypothetical protein
VFPSTAGIQASLRLNQMGAPLHDVLPYLAVLLSLGDCRAAGSLGRRDTARGGRDRV